MRLGFRTRLVAGSTLQVVAFVAAAMLVLTVLTHRYAAEQVAAATEQARTSFAQQMALRMRSLRRETREFARSPVLLAIAAIPDVDEATFADALAGMEAPLVAVLDPQGRVVAGRDGWRAGEQAVDAAALTRSLTEGVQDHVWRLRNRHALVAVAPLLQGGELLGALVRGEPVDDALARQLGTIAASDVLLWQGTEVLGAYWHTRPRGDVDLSPLHRLQPTAMPSTGATLELTVDELPRFGLALPLHRDGVMVFLSEDLRGIETLRDQARGWLLAAGGLLAILGVLVALHTAARLSRPLRGLTGAADRMSQGDLTARVGELPQDDELGQLARSFNTMATTVQRLVADVTDKAARAEAANRAKDGFLTSISHELRTPLTGIQSTAELLQQFGAEASPAERDEFLGTILRESERLGRRIGDALEFASLAAGTTTWTLGRVELQRLCEEACRRLDSLQTLKAVEFSILCPQGAALQGDREHLTQALWHLVHNAWQWSPAGGQVELTAREVANGFTIEVADRGPGVPAHERARVFEAFAQGGDVLVDKPQGIGIGLKIAAEIARLHGGSVEYADRNGGGACFCLLLRTGDRPIDALVAQAAAG